MACRTPLRQGTRDVVLSGALVPGEWQEVRIEDCEVGDNQGCYEGSYQGCVVDLDDLPERFRSRAEAIIRPWRRHKGSVLALLALLALLAVRSLSDGDGEGRGRGPRARSAGQDLVLKQILGAIPQECSTMDSGFDYVLEGDFLMLIETVLDAASCCAYCHSQERCHAWSWVEDATLVSDAGPGECWLKGGQVIQKVPRLGVVSAVSSPAPGLGFVPASALSPDQAAGLEAVTEAATESAAQGLSVTDAGHKVIAIGPSVAVFHDGAAIPEATYAITTTKPNTSAPKAVSILASSFASTTVAPNTTTTTTEVYRLNDNCTVSVDDGLNCIKSQCCREPGMQCYVKNEFWAQCMETCTPGPNLFDDSSEPWSCAPAGVRAPGSPRPCSEEHENCAETQCCSRAGSQCYAKNATFARCKPSCTPGVDMGDEDPAPWTCEALGGRAPRLAPWVREKCASDFQDCSSSRCCASPGMQCFLQNQWYGQCKPACTETELVKCNAAGPVTPMSDTDSSQHYGTVGAWVLPRCSDRLEDCSSSQCCHEVGAQCYRKDEASAYCSAACGAEPEAAADNSTWDCTPLGPRSWGLALKGFPSLYCLSVYMPSQYERDLLVYQLEIGGGIFACDGFETFAAEHDTLGLTKDGILVQATLIPKITVGVSQDGTAGNAKLFMAVWDRVIAGGRYRNFDWTIKVDPDAVLLPWRLRDHMRDHTGKEAYVVNCNKYPSSPNFPMMYGALEVFSRSAMQAYAAGSGTCGDSLPWELWGEDYYMTHCLDFLGVGRIGEFSVLGDDMCVGAHCDDATVASFHPFKSLLTWASCWATANGLPLPTSTSSTTTTQLSLKLSFAPLDPARRPIEFQ